MLPMPNLSFTGGSATSGGWGDTGFGDNKVTGGGGTYSVNFAPFGGTATGGASGLAAWLPWAVLAGVAAVAFFLIRK